MELRRLVGGLLAWNLIAIVTAEYINDCKHLLVSSTEYQTERNGRYKIMGVSMKCNGRQVYEHEGDSNYIYFLELADGWRGWMIGSTFCVNKGGMAVQDTTASPDKVNTRWEEVYDDRWSMTDAQVECTGPLSTGSIVGIVVGTIVLLLVVAGIVICCCKNQAKKGIVHGTGQPSLQRSVVATVAPAGRHQATVRQAPPPGRRAAGRAAHGYLGPAYQQQGAQNYPGAPPPPGWHSHPIAPPAYSSVPPAYPPSAYLDGQPKPEGFAAYPPNSMAPVDNGPPPSYTETQTHQVFTIASVHNQAPGGGDGGGQRPPPSNPHAPQEQEDSL